MEIEKNEKLSIIEKFFIRSGKITAVRSWDGGSIQEIDVHLPNADFKKWDKAQSIKCRISPSHYIDYTPSMWDAEKKSCTLYIDTSHNGEGSRWAQNQVPDNKFHYLKIEDVKHFPVEGRHLVFIGDQTGIGHFCALQQLAAKNTQISGFITFKDLGTAEAFAENCSWLPLKTFLSYSDICRQTEEWVIKNQAEKEQFIFYIVGNAELIVRLRKLLKAFGLEGSQIKSKGFWH